MLGRLRTIVLPASALWQLSSAVSLDPTITTPAVLPRQNSDNFIGYLNTDNTCKFPTSRSYTFADYTDREPYYL